MWNFYSSVFHAKVSFSIVFFGVLSVSGRLSHGPPIKTGRMIIITRCGNVRFYISLCRLSRCPFSWQIPLNLLLTFFNGICTLLVTYLTLHFSFSYRAPFRTRKEVSVVDQRITQVIFEENWFAFFFLYFSFFLSRDFSDTQIRRCIHEHESKFYLRNAIN